MEGTGQDDIEFFEVERLGDVIVSALLHRLYRDFFGTIGSHQHTDRWMRN